MELEIYILPGPDGKVRVSGPGHLHTASSYDLTVVSDAFRSVPPGGSATAIVSYLGHDVSASLARSDVFGNRMTGHLVMPEPAASDFPSTAPSAKPEFTVDSSFRVVLGSDGSTVAAGTVPVVVCTGVSDPSYEVDPPSGAVVPPGATPGIDFEIAEGSTRPVAGGTLYTRFKALEAAIASASSVTKEALGLGNVDNTSDADKPVSTAVADEITSVRSELARLKQAVENLTGTDIAGPGEGGGSGEGGGGEGGEGGGSGEINAAWLYEAVERLETDLDALAQRVTKVEEDQAGVVEQSNWVAERSAGLEKSLVDLMDKWRDAKSEMITLRGEVAAYHQSVTSSLETIASNRDRVTAVEARVDALEDAVVAGPLDVTGLTARVKTVEDRVGLAESASTAARETAEAAKSTADGLAGSVSSLETRLSEYSTAEAAFRTEMKAVADSAKAAADSAEAAVSYVSGNLESVVDEKVGAAVDSKVAESVGPVVSDLTGRVEGLEAESGAAGVVRPENKTASGTLVGGTAFANTMPVRILVNNAVNHSNGNDEVFLLPPPSPGGGIDLYIVETVPANRTYASFHVEPRVYEDLASSVSFVRRGRVFAGSGITSIASVTVGTIGGTIVSRSDGYPFRRFVIDPVDSPTICVFRLARVPYSGDDGETPLWTFVASLAFRCRTTDYYSYSNKITGVSR